MSLFALLSPGARSEMPLVLETIFLLYIFGSFLGLLSYATRQLRAGRLIGSDQSPPPLTVPSFPGWLFTFSVMALLFLQSPLYMMLVVVGLSAFLLNNRRTAGEQFGLRRMSPLALVKWSLIVCGAVIFVELPLSQLVELVMSAIHLPHPEQESVVIFRQYNSAAQIFAFLLQAVLLSPLIEELFFRGFLLTFLKNYTSTWFALVLSAGVFAFAHANLGSALQLWLLGLVLGLAYEHSGSILLPIGIHASWNFLTALSLLADKGNG